MPRTTAPGYDQEPARELGVMRVAMDRGLTKRVDVGKVSRGRYLTTDDAWLAEPVSAFITEHLTTGQTFLDPFAGEGHLLDVCVQRFGGEATGYDIDPTRWPGNDSLRDIPRHPGAIIITNPPYLAKHSAKRKGVLALATDYFTASGRNDLYKVALDRCLDAADVVVAIVPETFLLSDYPKSHLARAVVIEEPLFTDTSAPVCVACFDRREPGEQAVFVGDRFVATLPDLLRFRPSKSSGNGPDIRFNVAEGRIGLRAVDATDPAVRIGFSMADDFTYDAQIKHSSRLMTYLELPGCPDEALPTVITAANAILEETREATQDLVLSPFKGNNSAGRRRRRLDYGLARDILGRALAQALGAPPVEQANLFPS